MTFKANWEKTSQSHSLPHNIIEGMVAQAYSNHNLISYKTIAGGCANLNIKINLEDHEQSFILRIYLRDKDAAFREQQLSLLLKQTVPVPTIYYIGDYKTYRFAITEYISGITLSNLLLGQTPYELEPLMYEVGTILAKITIYKFPKAGFFDKDLNITKNITKDSYIEFAKDCLDNSIILDQLAPDIISKIHFCLEKYSHLFPEEDEKNLVHGDFDPANILVDKIHGTWKITGILDWEFSFSGSVLWDVANMLRYAHHMPVQFEEAFLQGLNSKNIQLPKSWKTSIYMLNLLSLLDCLVRVDPKNYSKQCADICELINHIIGKLKNL